MSIIKKIIFRHYGLQYHRNCKIDSLCPDLVELGKDFIAAPGSVITAHDASLMNKTGDLIKARVKIGDNVFLGANAVVLPGVTIGDNCIIGAGSVVTHNIPANSVAAGNPAMVLFSVQKYIELNKFKHRI